MNTGIRRFILRLIVGVLTFAVGVAAATLLGGFRPFQSYASPASYRYNERGYYRSLTAEPAYQYPVYEHSCKPRKKFRQMEPLPPADAPLPPSVR